MAANSLFPTIGGSPNLEVIKSRTSPDYFVPEQWTPWEGTATLKLSPEQLKKYGGRAGPGGYYFKKDPTGVIPGIGAPGTPISYRPGSGNNFVGALESLAPLAIAGGVAGAAGAGLFGGGAAAGAGSEIIPAGAGAVTGTTTADILAGATPGLGTTAELTAPGAIPGIGGGTIDAAALGAGAGLTAADAGAVGAGAGQTVAQLVAQGMDPTAAALYASTTANLATAVPGNLGANVIDPAVAAGAGGMAPGYSTTGIPGIDATAPAATGAAETPLMNRDLLAGITGKDLIKWGIPAAGLGTSLALGQRKLPQQAQLTAEQQRFAAQGSALIESANKGQVTPAQQAQIDRFKQTQMASAKQYLSTTGQSADSTAMLQMQANIDQQAMLLQEGFVQQNFSMGMQEMGISDAATAQLVQLQLLKEEQTTQALSNFMLTYGMMMGFGQNA